MISVDTVEEEVSRQRVVKEIVTKKLMLKKQDP